MKAIHVRLWNELEAYVGEACEGRDDSHGLPHMRLVTEHAVALFSMTKYQEAASAIIDSALTDVNENQPIDCTGATDAGATHLEAVRVLLSQGSDESSDSLLDFFLKHSLSDFASFNAEFLGSGQKELSASIIAKAGKIMGASRVGDSDSPMVKALSAWAQSVIRYFEAKAVPKQKALFESAQTTDGELNAYDTALARCIVIGMLHDVNDHKYEKPDGSLSKGLLHFVNTVLVADGSAFVELLFPAAGLDLAARADTIMSSVSAISFSKEKKNGMRYFVDSLGVEWTAVRDWVSDADKLEANGEGGLLRCWNFNLEMKAHKEGKDVMQSILSDTAKKETLRQANFKDVQDHVDEKLAILKDQYIVTPAGKRLATVAHDEMLALLQVWIANGPPQL